MDLSHIVRRIRRYLCQVRFQSCYQLRVEGSDKIIVILFLSRSRERGPREIIDVPGM
jgi:hypothetical protein